MHRFLNAILCIVLIGAVNLADGMGRENQPLCGFPITSQSMGLVKINLIHRTYPQSDTTFFVRKDVSDPNNQSFEEAGFTKVLITSQIDFYVETTEWESDRVNASIIDELQRAMLEETPAGSINPDLGIYQNEVNLFGPPPDIDHNGKIFILLMDVRDNYDPTTGGEYIAGYFDPLDQKGTSGNHSDILYIDTNPGLQSNKFEHTMTTAAHELQHLIHWGADSEEVTWINEGMSEVTAHLFNYPGRNFSYFLNEPTRTLTTFDQSVADYAKVGLWTLYLYSQYGTDLLTRIVQSHGHGIPGMNTVFATDGLPNFDTIFERWTIAIAGQNYLPDRTDTRIYRFPGFSIPQPEATLELSQFPAIQQSGQIKWYSSAYVRIDGGKNLSAQFFPPPGLSMDATLLSASGTSFSISSWQDVNSAQTHNFEGYDAFSNGWIVLTAKSTASGSGNFAVTIDGTSTEITKRLAYGSGKLSFYIPPSGGTIATDFNLPHNSTNILDAEVFLSGTESVTMRVRSGDGAPILAEKTFGEVASGWLTWSLDTLGLKLNSLFLEVTSQNNTVGFDTSKGASGHSFYKPPNSSRFQPITDFSLNGGDYTTEGDWMTRLRVSYPYDSTTTDTTEKILVTHWLNPVNMSENRVLFQVIPPGEGEIRIDIYNLRGRHVKTIEQNTGGFEWDGKNSNGVRVSSGIYFFEIQFGSRRIVRKLTILW